MTIYTWTYGAEGSGTHFSVVFDSATRNFTISALEGSVNIDALWFSNDDKSSDDYSLTKSDNNLNMNGSNTVWADDGTISSDKYVWDDFLKEASTTVVTAGGPAQVISAPADYDPEISTVLGVRATTSAGSVKWVDEHAQTASAPTLTVDNETVTITFDAAEGLINGADADALDADGDTVTFALTGTVPTDPNGNALFSIDAASGEISLTTAGAAHIGKIGTFTDYDVTIKASDGTLDSDTKTITITVTPPPGPVTVFDANGDYVNSYQTISAAVNAASTTAGATINVAAGTYSDALTISKSITLIGANAAVDGDGIRAEESNITGKITISGSASVTIDGFKIVNTTNNTTAYDAIDVRTSGNVVIEDNVFFSNGPNGSNTTIDRAVYITTAATGAVTVEDNLFTGAQSNSFGDANWTSAVWSDGKSSALLITDNVFEYVRTAMNLDSYVSEKVTVSANTIENAGTGISVGANTPETNVTFEGVINNEFQTVGTDFNLQNIGATKAITFDIGASGNVATTDGRMTVLGGGGGDTITGTTGTDVITGNAGSDTLTGNGGADVFTFNRAIGATNIDTIGDFGLDDTVVLDDAIFTGLSNANLVADFGTKLLYDSVTGTLSYDADGAGGNASIQFATITTGLELTAAEFVII